MKHVQQCTAPIVTDAFVIALVTYLVFFLTEHVKHGFVTNYVNMNWLLLIVIALGIVSVLLDDQDRDKTGESRTPKL